MNFQSVRAVCAVVLAGCVLRTESGYEERPDRLVRTSTSGDLLRSYRRTA
jgi:hypothetical protein